MTRFEQTFQDFCAGLADLPGGDFADRVNALLAMTQEATSLEADWAARSLIGLIAHSSQPDATVLGVLGDLLCRGINFWGYLPFYLAALGRSLALAVEVDSAIRPLLAYGKVFSELSPVDSQAALEGLPDTVRCNAQSWSRVDFLIAPALPILEQIKGARQLARAIGMQTAWLADCRIGVDWLPRLSKVFDAADEPLPEQATVIDAALAELRRQAVETPRDGESIRNCVKPIIDATTFVAPDLFDRTAAELARVAADADFAWASELAGMSGTLAERGANSEPGADALIAGLPRLLDPVVAFVQECRRLPTEENQSAVDVHGNAVLKTMPEARRALDALGGYCLGTIAHLARSPEARRRHGHHAGLLGKLDVIRWDTPNTGFLWKMLQVIDEELVIVAPEHKLGWRVRIGGVADNFQLYALIAGHLIGQLDDRKYPGKVATHDSPNQAPGVPISPRAVATQMNAPCTDHEPGFSSSLQLWKWTALQKGATLPPVPTAAYEHWIWNEGVPADITPFDGVRVVLLGPTNLHRSWNGGRIFPFMVASFEIVEKMSSTTAGAWLDRIAACAGH